jgi:Mn2+/Fe2+ NRAMP family transporter
MCEKKQDPSPAAGSKANTWRTGLQSPGPGIITAALIFGPSKITITTMLGTSYNYSLLWIVVVAVFFMAIFTSMSARIGIATQKSCILGLMSAILLVCSAAILHPEDVSINSATDMAKALEPSFGKCAAYIFLLGLFGASFSALIGNATCGCRWFTPDHIPGHQQYKNTFFQIG